MLNIDGLMGQGVRVTPCKADDLAPYSGKVVGGYLKDTKYPAVILLVRTKNKVLRAYLSTVELF